MNSRAFTLSLIIAGVAMFMVYSYLEGREGLYIEKYGKEKPVIIAKIDIGELEMLDETKVEIVNIPQAYVAPGAIDNKEKLTNVYASVPIRKGEQITVARLTYPGANTGLSRQVSVGKRAYSIAISDEQGVSKLIKPGDRVDVLAPIDFSGGRPDLLSIRTVLQDVLVLSTGLNITNNTPLVQMNTADGTRLQKLNTFTGYNTITLELDPFQIQKLVFLTIRSARLFLSLRNNDDKNILRINSTYLYDVVGDENIEATKEYFSKIKAGGN